MGNNDDKPNLFEKHAQTILTAVILSLLIGSGGLLLALREDEGILKTQVTFMNAQIQQGVDDRFRGADWRREKERLDERFQQLLQRVEKLEESHHNGNHYRLAPIK